MSDHLPVPDVVSTSGVPQGDLPSGGSPFTPCDPYSRYDRTPGMTSESEDDGFEEVLEVDRFPIAERPPFCRRREDQEMGCLRMWGDRACRYAVAVLALEDGRLAFECADRNLRKDLYVSSGLHVFSWCKNNLFFKGFKPMAADDQPPALEGMAEFTIANSRPGPSNWLRLRATWGGTYRSARTTFVYSLTSESPSQVAGYFPGRLPLCLAFQPDPTVNMEFYYRDAIFHYVYITSEPACGPLLSREGNWRIVDIESA